MRYFLVLPNKPNKEVSDDRITAEDDQGHGVTEALAPYAKELFECSARIGEVLPSPAGHSEPGRGDAHYKQCEQP
jgi:hypothetical protein